MHSYLLYDRDFAALGQLDRSVVVIIYLKLNVRKPGVHNTIVKHEIYGIFTTRAS